MRRISFIAMGLFACGCAQTPVTDVSPLLQEILALDSPAYTGGLTVENLNLAEHISAALAGRLKGNCHDPNPYYAGLIRLGEHTGPLPSLRVVDPNLAFLIRALDDPRQEVRDVAVYTMGLLGPRARVAIPFLDSKYSDATVKGGWYGLALEHLSCEWGPPLDYMRVIPDEIIAGRSRAEAAALVAKLFMDNDVEYPPDMLFRAMSNQPAEAVSPALRPIIVNAELSPDRRTDALQILIRGGRDYLKPALPELLRLTESSDPFIRDLTTDALLELGDEHAIPGLISRMRDDTSSDEWEKKICAFGSAAIAAQDRLMELAATDNWLRTSYGAIDALGCIRSAASIPQLTANLAGLDWQRAERSALALGAIGNRSPSVLGALRTLTQTHWSERVRRSGQEALMLLGAETSANPEAAISHALDKLVYFPFGGLPIDHGLPWCDNAGRYSIDGRNWFRVDWIRPELQRVPRRFPKTDLLIQSVGTQTFLRVKDGWLFGSNGFESEGMFAHVSDDGIVTVWEGDRPTFRGHASIEGMVSIGSRYFAYGYEISKIGDPGVLFEATRSSAGKWSAKRVAILPGGPLMHAVAPDGELLLSDGPNSYAVIESRIVPLKCEKVLKGSYFDQF